MEYVFSDGTGVFFQDREQWTVGITNKKGETLFPSELSLLKNIVRAREDFGLEDVCGIFWFIYDLTREEPKITNPFVFQMIEEYCRKFGKLAITMQKTYTLIYMLMVAECHKKHAVLNKMVIRLRFTRVVEENNNPETVMKETKQMSWRDLFLECCKRAFGDFDSDTIDCPDFVDTDSEYEEWEKVWNERKKRRGNQGD